MTKDEADLEEWFNEKLLHEIATNLDQSIGTFEGIACQYMLGQMDAETYWKTLEELRTEEEKENERERSEGED